MTKKRPSDYMIKGIVNGYTALDNTIMKGVNSGVRGWNWLTGETRADLANKFLTISPILEVAGAYGIPKDTNESISKIFQSVFTGLIWIGMNHFQQNIYLKMDELERKASEQELKDISVLKHKEICKIFGPFEIGSSALLYPFFINPELRYLIPLGLSCNGISCYIMRADYIPPKKNVFRRAGEKLAEIVRDYKKPQLEPSRAIVD